MSLQVSTREIQKVLIYSGDKAGVVQGGGKYL